MKIFTKIFTVEFWKQIDWPLLLDFVKTHPIQIAVSIIAAIFGWKIF